MGNIKDIHPKATFPPFLWVPPGLNRDPVEKGKREDLSHQDSLEAAARPSSDRREQERARRSSHTPGPVLENPWLGLGRAWWGRGKGQSRGLGEDLGRRGAKRCPQPGILAQGNIPRGANGGSGMGTEHPELCTALGPPQLEPEEREKRSPGSLQVSPGPPGGCLAPRGGSSGGVGGGQTGPRSSRGSNKCPGPPGQEKRGATTSPRSARERSSGSEPLGAGADICSRWLMNTNERPVPRRGVFNTSHVPVTVSDHPRGQLPHPGAAPPSREMNERPADAAPPSFVIPEPFGEQIPFGRHQRGLGTCAGPRWVREGRR